MFLHFLLLFISFNKDLFLAFCTWISFNIRIWSLRKPKKIMSFETITDVTSRSLKSHSKTRTYGASSNLKLKLHRNSINCHVLNNPNSYLLNRISWPTGHNASFIFLVPRHNFNQWLLDERWKEIYNLQIILLDIVIAQRKTPLIKKTLIILVLVNISKVMTS